MTEEKLNVISTDEEIHTLIGYLKGYDYVAYDNETTSLSLSAEITGMSVCADPNEAFYIITAIYDPETKELIRLPNKEKIIELLLVLKDKKLVTQNGLVDFNWTSVNYGVQLKDSCFHDVMISSHLLNENVSAALKERAYAEFGEDATKEQEEMKDSVIANGGRWEEKRGGNKDMYMADPYILGKYGAKDAILTLKLFHIDVPKLYAQNLAEYFYDLESMPLFRGPTYDLNTTGIKLNVEALQNLGKDLQKEMDELKASILADINPYIKEIYPGTSKKTEFNIGSSNQLAWLLFVKLENSWKKLTPGGKNKAKDLMGKIPYSDADKRRFVHAVNLGLDIKGKPYKLEKYLQCDKTAIGAYAIKYKWCENILKYAKAKKLLTTYVEGILEKVEYGVIRPRFNQIGTRGTRYSSSAPNFQNLPREDKRIKACMIARPGRIFVGADSSQIEARVFAIFSGDKELVECFSRGEDLYSVIGMRVFGKTDCTPFKEGSPNAFGIKYKKLRNISKVIALAICYGAEAPRLSDILGIDMKECQRIIDDYWEAYPTLKAYVDKCHKEIVESGVVYSSFGRPRRLPEAMFLKKLGWPNIPKVPGDLKTYLNMSVNQPIQMTAGTIINIASIRFHNQCKLEGIHAPIVIQVHDQVVAECLEADAQRVAQILQAAMESPDLLPGIKLEAIPAIGKSLADL